MAFREIQGYIIYSVYWQDSKDVDEKISKLAVKTTPSIWNLEKVHFDREILSFY